MVYGFVTTNVPSFVNYARLFGQVTEAPVEVLVATQAAHVRPSQCRSAAVRHSASARHVRADAATSGRSPANRWHCKDRFAGQRLSDIKKPGDRGDANSRLVRAEQVRFVVRAFSAQNRGLRAGIIRPLTRPGGLSAGLYHLHLRRRRLDARQNAGDCRTRPSRVPNAGCLASDLRRRHGATTCGPIWPKPGGAASRTSWLCAAIRRAAKRPFDRSPAVSLMPTNWWR